MTREELMKDAESFKDKEGYGYLHAELKDKTDCSIMLAGDRKAVEALTYEIINRLSETIGMPVELLLTRMLLYHKLDTECPDDTDTLEIE